MRTLIIIVITALATWFITSTLSVRMPLAPELDTTPSTQEQPEVATSKTLTVDEATAIAHRICTLINEERVKASLPELEWSDRLEKLAKEHSQWMATTGRFEHSENRVKESIFKAIGYTTEERAASAAVSSWLDSPSYKANVLHKVVKACAAGVASDNNTVYITFVADIY